MIRIGGLVFQAIHPDLISRDYDNEDNQLILAERF